MVATKNPASAFDWAETISDGNRRISALSSIIHKWKRLDPEQARNAIEKIELTDKEYEKLISNLK